MSFRVSLSAFLLSKLRRYASETEERMDRLFSYVSMTREALCALSVSERERLGRLYLRGVGFLLALFGVFKREREVRGILKGY